MLYLFAGDDTKKKLASYEAFLKVLSREVEIFFINKNDFDPVQLQSFYSGPGLFAARSVVVLRDILETEEILDFILPRLPEMGESANSFVFIERKLGKPILDAFKKARTELNIFELPKEKKEKYNNFLVANAFANRDKFHAWFHFRQAVDLGVTLDELAGVLFWKIKDMILRRNFQKFKEEELKNFAGRLAYLLPEARTQGPEAESALEQFLLEAF